MTRAGLRKGKILELPTSKRESGKRTHRASVLPPGSETGKRDVHSGREVDQRELREEERDQTVPSTDGFEGNKFREIGARVTSVKEVSGGELENSNTTLKTIERKKKRAKDASGQEIA